MPYQCAFGHTSYRSDCDACDSQISDQSTGWREPNNDTKDRFSAAKKGMTLNEYRDLEEDD